MFGMCRFLSVGLVLFSVVSCGGGGGEAPQPEYEISINVSGLSGTGLRLSNNSSDVLDVTGNSIHTFSVKLKSGDDYSISVIQQPVSPYQICSINNASGTVQNTDIDNISVSCVNNSAPAAVLLFPTAVSMTDSDSITVKGTASDVDGDLIQYVKVNGVSATSSDDFAHWSATIPLGDGANSITIELADAHGSQAVLSDVASVYFKGPIVYKPSALAMNVAGDELYVADSEKDAVVGINVPGGQRRVISGRGVGSGADLNGLYGLALNPGNGQLLIVDVDSDRILSVDPLNGNRSVVSSSTQGMGPVFNSVLNIDVDADVQIAYVNDRSNREIVAIDLATGDRSVISSNSVGSGTAFNDLYDLAVNTTTGDVLALDIGLDAVIKVSVDDGARTVVSDAATGGGAAIDRAQSIVYDAINNQAIVLCLDYIVRVNLDTGVRSLVSGGGTGSGEGFDFIRGVALSADSEIIYAAEIFNSNIVAVDAATGNRNDISGYFTGNALHYTSPRQMTEGLQANHITLVDSRNIFDINLSNGNKTIITGESVGTGATISGMNGGYYDAVDNLLYVANGYPAALWSVNPDTGTRMTVSQPGSPGVGSGASWTEQANAIAVKTSIDTAYLFPTTEPVVYGIDLQTGERAIVSAVGTGAGYPAYYMRDGLYDSANDRLLVVDSFSRSIHSIDPETGDRTLLSSNGNSVNYYGAFTSYPRTGNGNNFDQPLGIGINPTGTVAYVAERDLSALYEVDLASGNRSVLSDSTIGTGPLMVRPSKVLIDAERNVAFVSDMSFQAVYAIELDTGDRVVISK